MEYRILGRSGCVVSTLALGTLSFGRESSEDVSREQLDQYVEVGGNLIDTADVYLAGVSEEIIGRWLKTKSVAFREELVVATKGRFSSGGNGPNNEGLSRKHLDVALTASLRRLQLETIDLYQVHGYDPLTPIEETLRFLDDAVRMGKVRYVGLSNFTGWQIQKAIDVATFNHLSVPVSLQPQYNLLVRELEWEITPACAAEGLSLLPWSPLGGGWLTGKYRRDERPKGATRLGEKLDGGAEEFDRRNPQQRTWDVLASLEQVAKAREASLAQIALAWLVDRPTVTSVILGARTVEQLKANLGAAGLHLGPDEAALLDKASTPMTSDYPYGGPGADQRSRTITQY